ncbi:hypothetical protein B0J11DRAFT_522616 [Dendryphion nanum]|uniref:Uncharacterized protein n=1 Tax=Dendryphion nanum TaxID=256645 RepID=A0A9P9E3R4_9PLEO|nr:hypothetical protein B0J11DRAFT_522616 [Dendryphion nanum]
MHSRGGFQTIVLLTPPMFLLLPVSVLLFALERISHTLFVTQTTRNWQTGNHEITLYGPTNSSSSSYEYIDVSVQTNVAPTLAILGTGALAFIVAVVACCGIWELRRIQGSPSYQRAWSWAVLTTNFAVAIAGVAVLVWTSLLQSREGWKSYADVGRQEEPLTRETWACQIHHLFPRQSWAAPACGLARATRYMLIPLIISALAVLVVLGILIRDRGGMRWQFGGQGRYAGLAGAAELYNLPPQPPHHPTQPAEALKHASSPQTVFR